MFLISRWSLYTGGLYIQVVFKTGVTGTVCVRVNLDVYCDGLVSSGDMCDLIRV